MEDNRIVRAFAARRATGGKALLPFIPAGYPDLDTTAALLEELACRGVPVCELGFPFSDPIADGPTIQAAFTEALAAGVTTRAIFDMVRRFREQAAGAADVSPSPNPKSEIRNPKSDLALVAMVTYSIIYRHGPEAFLDSAAEAGFDGLIVPDLPLEEAAAIEPAAAARGLANIMLIAPTTPPDRRLEIARHCRGFIYFVSVAGITGERDRLPAGTISAVAELRRHTDTPVCVGFGISNPRTVEEVCRVADGAIVGSAIVHRITDNRDKGRQAVVRAIGEFVGELLEPIS